MEIEGAQQLAVIVADFAADVIDRKMPVAEPPSGRTYSGKFVVWISPDLHRRAALQAMARGESLNQFVVNVLTNA